MAPAYIFMLNTASYKVTVITSRDRYEVWLKLKMLFQAVSEASEKAKLTQLRKIKMAEKDSLIEFCNKFQSLVDKLSASRHQMTELEIKRALIRVFEVSLLSRLKSSYFILLTTVLLYQISSSKNAV